MLPASNDECGGLDDRLRGFLKGLGQYRNLVLRAPANEHAALLDYLQAHAAKENLEYGVVDGSQVDAEAIEGVYDVVWVGNTPCSQRVVAPAYWPAPGCQKLAAVVGLPPRLSSSAYDAINRVTHLGLRIGGELPADVLPDGSGFVYVVDSEFPVETFAEHISRWNPSRMLFDLPGGTIRQPPPRILGSDEIDTHVRRAIRKTINKFRENPYYFFTESDITSYLWMCLYTSRLEAMTAEARPVYLVHREYPTNFRYDKPALLNMEAPYRLSDRRGTRGNFDLAVLDPEFVRRAPSVEDIVNKNVRNLETRFDPAASEVLWAIEIKYVVNSSGQWETEIQRDNKKLDFAVRCNVANAVNLVFCNTAPCYLTSFHEAVRTAPPSVQAVFIHSYYDKGGVKRTPKPLPNQAGADTLLDSAGI